MRVILYRQLKELVIININPLSGAGRVDACQNSVSDVQTINLTIHVIWAESVRAINVRNISFGNYLYIVFNYIIPHISFVKGKLYWFISLRSCCCVIFKLWMYSIITGCICLEKLIWLDRANSRFSSKLADFNNWIALPITWVGSVLLIRFYDGIGIGSTFNAEYFLFWPVHLTAWSCHFEIVRQSHYFLWCDNGSKWYRRIIFTHRGITKSCMWHVIILWFK